MLKCFADALVDDDYGLRCGRMKRFVFLNLSVFFFLVVFVILSVLGCEVQDTYNTVFSLKAGLDLFWILPWLD